MNATIRDVARRAGVSISTVSRVLNDTAPVSEEKRTLVFEAAAELGYAPNPAALSLLSKQTGGIGVLLPFVSGEFFSELLHSLDTTAQEHGYFLLISTSHRHRDEFRTAMRVLAKRIDGLVVMAPELQPEDAQALAAATEPVVFVNTHADALPFDAVNFDNQGGAYALASHLLDLGHRRIAAIRGPHDARDAEQRIHGMREAIRDAGLPASALHVVPGEYTQEAGYQAAKELLAQDVTFTALACANDYCAFGAIRALHEAGLRVPEDRSVVGFDELPSTRFSQPPLTTARVPVSDIGRRAINLLLDRLSDDDSISERQRIVLPVELVIRGSTAVPARSQA